MREHSSVPCSYYAIQAWFNLHYKYWLLIGNRFTLALDNYDSVMNQDDERQEKHHDENRETRARAGVGQGVPAR